MDDQLLAAALATCHRALADYQAGLLSDAELRRTLFRAGLVYGAEEAMLLDLESGTWRRYNGITVSPGDAATGSEQSDVNRWKQNVEALRPVAGGT